VPDRPIRVTVISHRLSDGARAIGLAQEFIGEPLAEIR